MWRVYWTRARTDWNFFIEMRLFLTSNVDGFFVILSCSHISIIAVLRGTVVSLSSFVIAWILSKDAWYDLSFQKTHYIMFCQRIWNDCHGFLFQIVSVSLSLITSSRYAWAKPHGTCVPIFSKFLIAICTILAVVRLTFISLRSFPAQLVLLPPWSSGMDCPNF